MSEMTSGASAEQAAKIGAALTFEVYLDNQEYRGKVGDRQVLVMKRDPHHWRAYDMTGQALGGSDQYRFDLIDRLKTLPAAQLLAATNVVPRGADPFALANEVIAKARGL